MKYASFLAALAASTFLTSAALACTAVSTEISDCGAAGVTISTNILGTIGSSSYFGAVILNTTATANQKEAIVFQGRGSAKWELGQDLGANNSQNFYLWDDVAGAMRLEIDGNGNMEEANTIGVGAFAPGPQSITWQPGVTSSDSGAKLYGVDNIPGLGKSGETALFTNDPSMAPSNFVGLPMWATVTSEVRNTNTGTPGPNNNISAYSALGSNEGPSDDTGLSGSGTNEMVGYYANINCKVTNAHCWGSNQLVINAAGQSGGNLIGDEINVVNNQASSSGQALRIIGGSTQNGSYNGISVLKFGATAKWQDGIYFASGAALTAVDIGAAAASGSNVGSMPVNFGWIDSGGNPQGLTLAADSAGDFVVTSGAHVCKLVPATGTVNWSCT